MISFGGVVYGFVLRMTLPLEILVAVYTGIVLSCG